jgi:hypothetical protein
MGLAPIQDAKNSNPYLLAMAQASSEAFCVGIPVYSIVTSAIIASKTPPGELMMIWRPTSGPLLTNP